MIGVTALEVGWAVGLAVGVPLLVVVVWLLHRVLRPILEIRRYAEEILEAGLGIAGNLDGVDEAVRTRDLATALPPALAGDRS